MTVNITIFILSLKIMNCINPSKMQRSRMQRLNCINPIEEKDEALVVSEPNVLEVGLCVYGVCLRLIR